MSNLIELNDGWMLTPSLKQQPRASAIDDRSSPDHNVEAHNLTLAQLDGVPFCVPGDVHSALMAAQVIEDPYYRDNEFAVDWVNQTGWLLTRRFDYDLVSSDSHVVLLLDRIDCIAIIRLNDELIGDTVNQFVRYAFDISQALRHGDNQLSIEFLVSRDIAAESRKSHPFDLPDSQNCRIPNNHFLRKTPCHSGWDWNICLMPSGIYGSVCIADFSRCRIDDVCINQTFDMQDVTLAVSIRAKVFQAASVSCLIALGNTEVTREIEVYPGEQSIDMELTVSTPDLWWPQGLGEQTLYGLRVVLDDQQWQAEIGIRESRIVCKPDSQGPGSGFAIEINGRAVFMRGANWIPADALPARGTPEVVRELLTSAVDANMNMLRVWGGGQYEADWFYGLCDELGILVWQDFMFSCNHYPATDPAWMASVRKEATQQVRRLSRFACVALWCGDNELVGALQWWEVTRNNRDRYLANYVRLNTALEEIIATEVPQTSWWPSSPSQGLLDYADGWKSDAAGDMHFWDVWHEARPFSAYQEIRPRFCSEFGFQSFSSMPMVKSFAEDGDCNISSRVMEVHQRNEGGNARIAETLVRYFKFPDSFERTVFLSQCQQAMAIRTGVEYWRSLKPHCMGTLYWQLNDTWPVASWSSLEYGGAWKLLHYAARRFYRDVMLMIVPVDREGLGDTSPVCLRAVSDQPDAVELRYEVQAIDMTATVKRRWSGSCTVGENSAIDELTLAACEIPVGCFLSFQWERNSDSECRTNGVDPVAGEGEYWPRPYKDYELPVPEIHVKVEPGSEGRVLELETDKPAFFVTVELGGRRVWSDNGFTLLPDRPKKIYLQKTLTHAGIPDVAYHTIDYL
ncbi:MAG: glycoside hydrolase family 2 protein [Granulosicoccus sp.]